MNKNSKNSIYIFTIIIVLLVLATIAFVASLGRPISSTLKLSSGETIADSNLSVLAEHREGDGTSWTKDIWEGNERLHTVGAVYDISVTNLSKSEISNWSLKIVANESMYINNAWCGTVEIHQDSYGKIQTLDLREVKKEDVELTVNSGDRDILILLNPGDYIIYTPNKDVAEIPLQIGQKTTVGFIFYTTNLKEFYSFEDDALTYTIIPSYKSMPEYYAIIALVGLLILMCIYFIAEFAKNKQVQALYEKEKRIVHETMATFVGFVDAKDPYTAGHSERVAQYTKMIAKKLGYSEDDSLQAYYCGILHDTGKIYISENVLNKPGKLTADEFEIIKTHTTTGHEILKNLTSVPLAAAAARHHHERYDGTGYPDQIKGDEIPEIARIICVADAFDAMNSNRVYRNALTKDQIIEQLTVHSGTQFDPRMTEIFLELLKEGKVENF